MTVARDRIVAAARGWIGTPYRHQASVRGGGCDCLGLVRGIYRELYGAEPEKAPPYTSDWGEALGQETLLDGARRNLPEIEIAAARDGDLLVFRLRAGTPAKHLGILTNPLSMIHAVESAPVCEVHMGRWWRRHAAAAFSFPGVD